MDDHSGDDYEDLAYSGEDLKTLKEAVQRKKKMVKGNGKPRGLDWCREC